MTLLESIEKFLSFADRDLIAYDIILGSLLGGIGVGLSQASFIDDFPNIIELIIGTMILINEGFQPFLRSLGFVLTADGFTSLIKKVFTSEECENCIPFNCLSIIPMYVDTQGQLVVGGNNTAIPIPPECKKYYEEFQNYKFQHISYVI